MFNDDYEMPRRKLTRCEAYHEVGHAIVALVFNGYLTDLQGIILNEDSLISIGGNKDDLAYTHVKRRREDTPKLLEENEHLCVLVDGLFILAGVAGASFLCPEIVPNMKLVTRDSFTKELNMKGAEGDFEIITKEQAIYPWHLIKKYGYDQINAFDVHARLMNVLQNVFLKEGVRSRAQMLYSIMDTEPNKNVELDFIKSLFDESFVQEIRGELENVLAVENFGELARS